MLKQRLGVYERMARHGREQGLSKCSLRLDLFEHVFAVITEGTTPNIQSETKLH